MCIRNAVGSVDSRNLVGTGYWPPCWYCPVAERKRSGYVPRSSNRYVCLAGSVCHQRGQFECSPDLVEQQVQRGKGGMPSMEVQVWDQIAGVCLPRPFYAVFSRFIAFRMPAVDDFWSDTICRVFVKFLRLHVTVVQVDMELCYTNSFHGVHSNQSKQTV